MVKTPVGLSPDGDRWDEVFGLLAHASLSPSPFGRPKDWIWKVRHQLPQRVCSGVSPDSMHPCINVGGGLASQHLVSN